MQVLNTQRHATDTDRDGGVGGVPVRRKLKSTVQHGGSAGVCVPAVCVSFWLGWGGFGIQVTGNLHGVIGAWLATASSQRRSTKHLETAMREREESECHRDRRAVVLAQGLSDRIVVGGDAPRCCAVALGVCCKSHLPLSSAQRSAWQRVPLSEGHAWPDSSGAWALGLQCRKASSEDTGVFHGRRGAWRATSMTSIYGGSPGILTMLRFSCLSFCVSGNVSQCSYLVKRGVESLE